MKNFFLLAAALFLSAAINAQTVSDQVDLGAGYVNQVYYNLNGTKTSVDIGSWDIGFCTTLMDGGIINNANTVTVFKASNVDSGYYANITSIVGLYLTAQYNSDTNWYKGAFNVRENSSNPFDFGWGIYDFNAHAVFGDSLFIIQKGSDYYKFWIRTKNSNGDYIIRYAKLDGSPDVDMDIPAASYSTKNFIYLNLDNPTVLDFEPANTDWQLLFTHYITMIPYYGPYPVTGVLSNIGFRAAKAGNVILSSVNPSDYISQLSTNESVIGYDWKRFNMSTFQYEIVDSLIYYLSWNSTGISNSIRFTGFNDTTGLVSFDVGQLSVGINEVKGDLTKAFIYPNPVQEEVNLVYDAKQNASVTAILYDMTGREVMQKQFTATAGVNNENLEVPKLSSGLYHLVLNSGEGKISMKVMVSQ